MKFLGCTAIAKSLPCADGVRVDDLAFIVLQQVAEGAVQDTRRAHGEGGCMLAGPHSLSASLNANQPHILVIHQTANACTTLTKFKLQFVRAPSTDSSPVMRTALDLKSSAAGLAIHMST